MRRHRKIKIVATLGPASSTKEMIRALHEAGADVFRLNMSHGSHEDVAARHRIIREVEAEGGQPIAILADLQGPKLRVGTFGGEGAFELEAGQAFRLDLDPAPGDATRVLIQHIYESGFRNLELGYAAALSLFLFVVMAVVSAVQFRLMSRGA